MNFEIDLNMSTILSQTSWHKYNVKKHHVDWLLAHISIMIKSSKTSANSFVVQGEVAFLKADFQSVEFSERAEFLLFVGENVALKFNR